uniref:Endonuclease/exonuclease/phosphatase domain-containing protein n=1 Tax=Sparus aurata TaxID=8175 RepID=A0A671YEM9_SPAAU
MGHGSWTGVGQEFIIQRVRVIDGRILCVDVSRFKNKFRVNNVYCPVELQERLAVLKELQPLLLCSREVILGGDFNCLVNKKDKLTTSTVRLDSSSEILQNIMKDFQLMDAYRSKNPVLPGRTAIKRRLKLQKHEAKLQRFHIMAYSGLDVAEDIVKLKREMSGLST